MSARASAVSVLPTPDGPTKGRRPSACRVFEVGAGRAHPLGDGFQGVVLADHPRLQQGLEAEHGADLVLDHLAQRDARPGGDDLGHTWPSTCSGTIGASPWSSRRLARAASSSLGSPAEGLRTALGLGASARGGLAACATRECG
jgi:hypothetical protein